MTRPRDIADSINRINSSAADATAVTIDSSENVGIGTTSPSTVSGFTVLEVAGSSNGGFIKVTDGTVTNSFYNSGSVGAVGTQTSHPFALVTAGAERMRVLAGGGLTFNGDTAAANALDDYEEGSWTPVVAAGWTSVTFPNSYQIGKYQKVGNVVEAFFFLQFSGTNAGAHVQINGLPYVAANENAGALRGGALTYFNIPVDSSGMVMPYVFQNATNFRLYAGNDGGASTLSNGNASDSFLIGSVRYRVS